MATHAKRVLANTLRQLFKNSSFHGNIWFCQVTLQLRHDAHAVKSTFPLGGFLYERIDLCFQVVEDAISFLNLNLNLPVKKFALGSSLFWQVPTVTTKRYGVRELSLKVSQLVCRPWLCQEPTFQKVVNLTSGLLNLFAGGFSTNLSKLCLTDGFACAANSFPCAHQCALSYSAKQRAL